jgi:hypothetical protein
MNKFVLQKIQDEKEEYCSCAWHNLNSSPGIGTAIYY